MLDVGLALVQALEIDSHRAEYTLFEAARAHAASDGRDVADMRDLRSVAVLALRERQSEFMTRFFEQQEHEDARIHAAIDQFAGSR